MCLKINDLAEAEKLDLLLRALAPNTRMQVQFRGPTTFGEVACANNVFSEVTG